jgi:hypothetical protein
VTEFPLAAGAQLQLQEIARMVLPEELPEDLTETG